MKYHAITKSIPFKLSVILSLTILVVSMISEIFSYYNTTRTILTALNEDQLKKARIMAQEVDIRIQQRIKFIKSFAKLIANNIDSQQLDFILGNAVNMVDLFPQGLFLLSADGTSVIAEVSQIPVQDILSYDKADWLKKAKQKDGVFISKVFRSQGENELMLIFAVAIHDNTDAVIGVLTAPILLNSQQFLGFVYQDDLGNFAKPLIVSKSDNVVIASANKNLLLKSVPNQELYKQHKTTDSSEATGFFINKDGTKDIAAFSTVTSLDWIFVVRTNSDTAFIPARIETIKGLLTELFLLSIIVIVIFITLRIYFSPLHHSAQQVRAMDLDKELHRLRKVRDDEIGDLIAGFNLLVNAVNERTLKLKEANQHLQELSQTDGLTGVSNRRWFDHSLAHLCRVHQRNKEPLSLIILDIDFFKKYNDSYGHLQGV